MRAIVHFVLNDENNYFKVRDDIYEQFSNNKNKFENILIPKEEADKSINEYIEQMKQDTKGAQEIYNINICSYKFILNIKTKAYENIFYIIIKLLIYN